MLGKEQFDLMKDGVYLINVSRGKIVQTDALVAALLDYLVARFADALDSAFPQARSASRRACAETVYAVTGQPAFAPFLRVWWDIVAGCSAGNGPNRPN